MPCPKPANHRLVADPKTGPIKRGASYLKPPTTISEEPSFRTHCAYLSRISPEQTLRLRKGETTTIQRPYTDFWKARLNAPNGNGIPRTAAVMMMTPGISSGRSEEFAVTSCLLVGEKLQFTLDPSATCHESDGEGSSSSRENAIASHNPEPKSETKTEIVKKIHHKLDFIMATDISSEQLAILKGVEGELNSLLVPRRTPPETTATPARDALGKVKIGHCYRNLCGWLSISDALLFNEMHPCCEAAIEVADNPELLEELKNFVSLVDQGPTSEHYRRAKLNILLAETVLEDRKVQSARPSGDSTPQNKRRLSKRVPHDDVSHETNKENEGQSRISLRSPCTPLGSSASSNTVQSGIGAADKVVLRMLQCRGVPQEVIAERIVEDGVPKWLVTGYFGCWLHPHNSNFMMSEKFDIAADNGVLFELVSCLDEKNPWQICI